MNALYPAIGTFDEGRLDVGDGNTVHWEVGGNPAGKPAVVLHGGPGSGCTPGWLRYFDPEAYRIVLLDQRGCGRSTPDAADPDTDLAVNTTPHLIVDLELLRSHLGIERWLVFGGSWGTTLGLAYAQLHPSRVSELVLFSVVTTSRREVEWVTRDVGRLFPERWARFRDGVPADQRDGSLVDAYAQLLESRDAAVHGRLDVSGPPDIAWELARAWPDAELVLVDRAGHGSKYPGMAESVVAATDRFRP